MRSERERPEKREVTDERGTTDEEVRGEMDETRATRGEGRETRDREEDKKRETFPSAR